MIAPISKLFFSLGDFFSFSHILDALIRAHWENVQEIAYHLSWLTQPEKQNVRLWLIGWSQLMVGTLHRQGQATRIKGQNFWREQSFTAKPRKLKGLVGWIFKKKKKEKTAAAVWTFGIIQLVHRFQLATDWHS
jgi:hypothetical protein